MTEDTWYKDPRNKLASDDERLVHALLGMANRDAKVEGLEFGWWFWWVVINICRGGCRAVAKVTVRRASAMYLIAVCLHIFVFDFFVVRLL